MGGMWVLEGRDGGRWGAMGGLEGGMVGLKGLGREMGGDEGVGGGRWGVWVGLGYGAVWGELRDIWVVLGGFGGFVGVGGVCRAVLGGA